MKLFAVTAAVLLGFSSTAYAEKREVWSGWTDVPIPCTEKFTYRDSLGIEWPSLRTRPQEHHTKIYLDVPTWKEVEAKAKECALLAVGTAGAAVFYTSGAAAWPAFKATFTACMAQKGMSIGDNVLSIEAGFVCK